MLRIQTNAANKNYNVANTNYNVVNTNYNAANTNYNVANVNYNVANTNYNVANTNYNVANMKLEFWRKYDTINFHSKNQMFMSNRQHYKRVNIFTDFMYDLMSLCACLCCCWF